MNSAACASSMTRLSADSCRLSIVATRGAEEDEEDASARGGITLEMPAPTAKMHACGGLMTAEKELSPNMPKFDMEKEPPWNSSGFSLPSRARPAKSFTTTGERKEKSRQEKRERGKEKMNVRLIEEKRGDIYIYIHTHTHSSAGSRADDSNPPYP